MSLYYTFRSFAICLAVTIIISESPVSAFTIRRTWTTTLKSTFDLTGQESALLEVKNDLPKINSKGISQKESSSFPRDTIKELPIATKPPTRTSANALEVGKKTRQTISMSKNEVLLRNSTNKETEVIDQLDQIKSTIDYGKSPSSNSDFAAVVTEQTDFSISGRVSTNYEEPSENLSTDAITTEQNNINSTQIREVISDGMTEIYSETLPTTEVSSTETMLDNLKFLVMHENSTAPITITDTTITDIGSTDTKKKMTTKENDNQTETMTVEASSSVTNNPSWKTYTTIERKHTTSAEREESTVSTEQGELLTKAETVPATISLENAANYTSIPSLNELRQELISNSKTYNTRSDAEASTSLPNDQSSIISSPALVSNLPPTTSNSDTGPDNIVTSKRAGFLDLTIKQTDSKDTTTTDSLSLNAKELIGTLFEVDLQENDDSSETKNVSESQRQTVEDAIKEKLLEEELLNDNFVKSYQREMKSSESSEGKIEPVTEDSLSVKPISPKSAIYTVSPHYKKMKKIEVQPLKPFIRDPDDNSWRNESLSLLGIVFKAKNASKPFTQVLKNKTEAELNNISEKSEKFEVTDLRERLEKIAEIRKSRKKINKTGDTVYNDYEESNSGETNTTPKTETTLPVFDAYGKLAFVGQTTLLPPVTPELSTTRGVFMYKEKILTTNKPKKINKFAEYYDTTDEYDADYVTLPKLDLKKFTTSFYNKDTATTPPMLLTTHAKSLTTYWPDRKPTVQYFPPRPQRPTLNLNDYDRGFEKKVNMFSVGVVPKDRTQARTVGTIQTTPLQESKQQQQPDPESVIPTNKTVNLFKNFYATIPSRVVEPGDRYTAADDETFNRASYVIKHYKDLIDEAVKDDYDKNGEYIQSYTDSPLTGVTVNEMGKGRLKMNMDNDYDYVSNFRKDILNKFVDTFNKNSQRFKVDFPILYNSSVVHRQAQDDGRVLASSSAFLKRQYGDVGPKACEPHCDLKVELSPAYELHYYVPDQEEREEVDPKQPPLPYTYRL